MLHVVMLVIDITDYGLENIICIHFAECSLLVAYLLKHETTNKLKSSGSPSSRDTLN